MTSLKLTKSETELKKEICDALDKMGIFWRRLNSGKVKCRGGGWMQLCPEVRVLG
jgi:hypothetical protein